MSILVAQIGDVHIKAASDLVMSRARYVGAAIAAECDTKVSRIILAVCGDAAYSGAREQFQLAQSLVEGIETEIRKRNASLTIDRILIPGNHDCDFGGDQAARNAILPLIKDVETPPVSIVDIAMTPLKQYFDFSLTFTGPSNAINSGRRFYDSVDFLENGKSLRIHLLNTAWMSVLHEQPGTLHFPLTEIAPPSEKADCSIAILHHPLNWFSQPHVMRPLRDRVAQLAPVILVNHEHVAEAVEQQPLIGQDSFSKKSIYVSGGVLQEDSQPDICNFNILNIDIDSKTLIVSRHDFRQGHDPYFERTASDRVVFANIELSVGPGGAALTEEMAGFLDDPGVPISHPRRDPRLPIRLRDIFLFPDLWELDEEHDGSEQKQIRSANVAERVLSTKKVLITGGEKSGRTSLAKGLFSAAFESGKLPLMLSGDELPKKAEQLRDFVRKAVKAHYHDLTPDAYEQLPAAQRIIIIDDIHRLVVSSEKRELILKELERHFDSIILCGDDVIKLDELSGSNAKDSGLWEYRHLVILGFGEFLREQFVRRWILVGGDTFPNDSDADDEVERVCELLNVVIRRQLLPAYPLFLLLVLQNSDLANASVQGGSFGKLFEGVITVILSKSQFQRISIGDKYHYLAALAKYMFDAKAMSLPIDQVKNWHKEYWEAIEISIDFERLQTDLVTLGVLAVNDDEVRFRYTYFFCFFVAYFLNRTVHDEATRQVISQLCGQLHHRVSADVVLFLANLTGDPLVLNEMVKTCDNLFSDVKPASLGMDVETLNRMGETVGAITISDKPDENRRELRLRRDALVKERLAATKTTQNVAAPEADNALVKRLFDLHAAYKTIQILGQALRNIAGSASKERKEEIIDKIVGLTKRVLGSYFELFAENVFQSFLEDIAAAHHEQQPELSMSDLYEEICRHLNGTSLFVCFSVMKHATFSVGSQNLTPTIHRVLRKGTEPMDKIFDLSFDLEQPGKFPKDEVLGLYRDLHKNQFSANLVRLLVAHHMYIYTVPYKDKQTVCQKLTINLLPTAMDPARKRLKG